MGKRYPRLIDPINPIFPIFPITAQLFPSLALLKTAFNHLILLLFTIFLLPLPSQAGIYGVITYDYD